jgi:type I restriction enzyme S subunit
MADQTTGKVPRIRFKATSEPWIEEKIGDILAEKRRTIVLEDDQRYELITVKRRNEGVVSRGHLLGREILVKNYAELKAGDFVISKRQVVHGATGIVPPALDGAIVSNEYLTAVDSEKLLTEFLTILASLPAMRRKFFLSSYGVDIEKLFFDTDDWKKRSVLLPDVQEQSRIAKVLRDLDQLIALHKLKHAKLVAIKKAMLASMFTRPSAAAPEVRFQGFDENWRAVRFDLIATRRSATSSGEKLPRVEYEDIASGEGRLKRDVRRASSEKRGILFEKGDILFGKLRPYLMNMWLAEFPGVAVGDFWVLKTADCDPTFLFYFLQTADFMRIANQSSGSKMPRSDWKLVSGSTFRIPKSTREQQKIGEFLHILETFIHKHATQLVKLRQIKLACQDEMFV